MLSPLLPAAGLIAFAKPYAGPAIAGISRGRGRQRQQVKSFLKCDERAGARIDLTSTPGLVFSLVEEIWR